MKRRFVEDSTLQPNVSNGIQSGKAALDALPAAKSDSVPMTMSLSTTPPAVDIDEFHKLLTRWFVKRNRPFTDMDNEEFRDLLVYLDPSLDGRLPDSSVIRDHVEVTEKSTKQ
ncbi:hypothetical protein FRC11_012978 [Ceratobasidium sp. 423]|nr:hypothetical protein FRC11_012978 [Ceratobasidium sp. 423]